eukprot:PITA_19521
MDHILQRVVGASHISLLDGYLGYNQILVHEDDRDKIVFTTPWGTFHYAKMPFGLKNTGVTFQRAMDIAFANEEDVFLVDYLDDLTVFSNSDEEHLYHLKIVYQWCRNDLDAEKRPAQETSCIFSRTIRDAALKYNIIKKQAISLVKALKEFRVYILHSHILAYVPNAVVKDVLLQTDPEGRRGKWIAALLEYDVEFKPTKLIKGQVLAKLMAESNFHPLDINIISSMSEGDEESLPAQVSEFFLLSPWYSDIVYVLQNLSRPPGMAKNKSRTLKLKASKFCIMNNALYWKDLGGVLLNCLVEEEEKKVMEDFHKGDCGGHIFWKTTANKILRAGYY